MSRCFAVRAFRPASQLIPRRWAFLIAVVATFVVALSGAVPAQQRVAIAQVPYQVQTGKAVPVGRFDPQQMLRLVIALKPPHMEQEEQFLRELRDLDSPNFHKFLSEAEWNARQAEWLPTDEDRAFVASLMGRVVEPGKFAHWIAPPAAGINRQPIDFEYVRFG